MRTEIYSTKRAYPHRRKLRPQLSVARLVWRAARNGLYRKELRQVLSAIGRYLAAHQLPQERARLAVRWAIWHRGRAGGLGWLLVRDARQRVRRAGSSSRPGASAPAERLSSSVVPPSQLVRSLYDCPDVPVGPAGVHCRVVVATHPAGKKKSRVGVTRSGVVYELFFTKLPQQAFTASDVVELYLHRGAFETALADEDQEQATSRWCSHSAAGQELWQVISQWVWNLRLELGHQLHPDPVRTTEFAPAHLSAKEQQALSPAPAQGYGPIAEALPWKQGRFSGRDFVPQPDGTLRCPAGQPLRVHERRREADGSLRVVYAASVRSCRPCPLREQCQWQGRATTKPRQVSMLLHPLVVGSAPLRLRVTGIVGTIDGRAYNCSGSLTWRCR